MTPLITALLGTAALLVGLCLVIQGGWWLVLRLMDPLLERSRLDVQQERILRHHQLLERHRQERARQIARPRRRVVDLEGQVCWLLPEELRAICEASGTSWSWPRAAPGPWCASTGSAAACAGIPTTAAIRPCGCASSGPIKP